MNWGLSGSPAPHAPPRRTRPRAHTTPSTHSAPARLAAVPQVRRGRIAHKRGSFPLGVSLPQQQIDTDYTPLKIVVRVGAQTTTGHDLQSFVLTRAGTRDTNHCSRELAGLKLTLVC
jgi:hypothetical protein